MYVGDVVGYGSSDVALAFSKYGSRGWIQREDDLFHLLAQTGPNGNWKQSTSLMVSDQTLVAWGNQPQPLCETSSLPPMELPAFPDFEKKGSGQQLAVTPDLLNCPVAIETDYQLFQIFNDVNAETAYVTTLLSLGQRRYEEQISDRPDLPLPELLDQLNDPWDAPDDPDDDDCVDAALRVPGPLWQFNVPGGGLLGALRLRGAARLRRGLAAGRVQRRPTTSRSARTSGGTVQFPIQVRSRQLGLHGRRARARPQLLNALAHARLLPAPLDECAPSGYFGGCQTQQVCTRRAR